MLKEITSSLSTKSIHVKEFFYAFQENNYGNCKGGIIWHHLNTYIFFGSDKLFSQ